LNPLPSSTPPLVEPLPNPPLTLVFNTGEELMLAHQPAHDAHPSMTTLAPITVPPRMPAPWVWEHLRQLPTPVSVIPLAALQPRNHVRDTTIIPYFWVINLEVTFPDATFGYCSGWLFDDSVIATAGHCVYNEQYGGWAQTIITTPGRNSQFGPFPFP
jgi:V8-like Glu-specific endopeptidase